MMKPLTPLLLTAALLLPVASAACTQNQPRNQPPVTVANSPPPIIAVPSSPETPVLILRSAGRVRVMLDVGPDGRAHGCAVTRSSGSSALDSATCMILRRRARFTPAIDSNGNPAAGRIGQEIEWRLPE